MAKRGRVAWQSRQWRQNLLALAEQNDQDAGRQKEEIMSETRKDQSVEIEAADSTTETPKKFTVTAAEFETLQKLLKQHALKSESDGNDDDELASYRKAARNDPMYRE